MYCSRCATLITEDLNFCSKCGERVKKEELTGNSKKQSEMLDNLAITVIFVGSGGLLFLVGLVAVLLEKILDPVLIVGVIGLYIAGWLAVCFKLLGQISKLVDANIDLRRAPRQEAAAREKVGASVTAQLEEYREPIDFPSSVTESTTQSLGRKVRESRR